MGVIIFGGRSCLDYGIHVEKPPDWQSPEKDCEMVHVPGRNGDLFVDTGAYNNAERRYTVSAGSLRPRFMTLAERISEWLHTSRGYARLEDSYEPDYYRMAVFREALELTNIYHQAGRAEIVFDCMPQRFLKSGERPLFLGKITRLRNPTWETAQPLFRLSGHGELSLSAGGRTVTIHDLDGSITIDSEEQDAYDGEKNMNPYISLTGGFPVLPPGESDIVIEGDLESGEVIPRWWLV